MMKNLLKTNLFIFILLLSTPLIAQNKVIDSFKKEVNNHLTPNTERVDLINKLALKLYNKNADTMLALVKESKALSKTLHYKYGEANSLFVEGEAYATKHKYSKSVEFYKLAQQIYKEIDSLNSVATCDLHIGYSLSDNGKMKESLDYFNKSINYFEQSNNKKYLGKSHKAITGIYAVLGKYKKALYHGKKALQIAEIRKDTINIIANLNNIAATYYYENKYSLAIDSYKKAIQLTKKNGKTDIASLYNNIGVLYTRLEKYEDAYFYHNKAIEYCEKYNIQNLKYSNIYNIGWLQQKQKKYKKAINTIKKVLVFNKKTNNNYRIVECLYTLGDINVDKQNYPQAFKYLDSAKNMAENLDLVPYKSDIYYAMATAYFNKEKYKKALLYALKSENENNKLDELNKKRDNYKLLSKIYAKNQQYKKAYKNQLIFKKLDDSLNNKKTIRKIAEIEYQYKYQNRLKKAKETEKNLNKKVEVVSKSLQKSKKYLLWFLNGFLLLIILVGIYLYKQKINLIKADNKQILLEQQLLRSQMTPHFLFNSLSVIQGMVLNNEENKAIVYLSKFSKLLRIILDNSSEKLVPLDKELNAIKNYIDLQNLRRATPIEYTLNQDENSKNTSLLIPPMLIQPFVENAIIHGFNKTINPAKIDITITFENKTLLCIIKDNGIGIDAKRKTPNSKKSLATRITKDRLVFFAKEYNVTTDFSIKDRRNFNEQGTIVSIKIPYKINKNA